MKRLLILVGVVLGLLSLGAVPAAGQMPVPRQKDGKPNMSGIWQVMNAAAWNVEDHNAQKDVPAGIGVVEGGAIPYLPDAAEKRNENYANRATRDPLTKCFMPGVPRITYLPYPFQIIQTPNFIMIMYEFRQLIRNIYINSKHPDGAIDWWLGDSRARWEGDTLVNDVVDLIEDTWLDKAGNFHSDQLHVIERYTLTDADHIKYEATLEDPKVYSRPWKMSMILYRHKEPNVQLLEYECFAYEVLPPD